MSSAALAGTRADARRLADSACDEVKRRILLNLYPGGFQILEELLCEELGMSRTPLREALVRLQKFGIRHIWNLTNKTYIQGLCRGPVRQGDSNDEPARSPRRDRAVLRGGAPYALRDGDGDRAAPWRKCRVTGAVHVNGGLYLA